ncbi:MAG: hypothetical protein QW468_04305 [Candidatus Bathyarchaeia archaeon]
MNHYSLHGLNSESIKLSLPEKEVDIELPKEIADKLNPIAVKIGEQFDLYGIRAKINLRSLLKALAYRNEKEAVSEAEFKEFLELTDFMNFRFNPLR